MTRTRSSLLARSQGRFWIILACLLSLGCATALTLRGLSSSMVFFQTPSQLLSHSPSSTRTIRLGGMVVAGSVHQNLTSTPPDVHFDVTDGQDAITVHYNGILPDLFREGQSIVTLGHLDAHGVFRAEEVLAKHDETYMPKDVADALKKSGRWDPRFGPPPDAARWNSMTAPQQDKQP